MRHEDDGDGKSRVLGIPKILVRVSEVFFVIEHFDSIGAFAQNCHLIFAGYAS